LRLSGWALDGKHGAPAAYVDIKIDSQSRRAVYGLPRPDVASLYKDPRATNVEFELTLPLRSLSSGKHSVSLWMHSQFSQETVRIQERLASTSTIPPTGQFFLSEFEGFAKAVTGFLLVFVILWPTPRLIAGGLVALKIGRIEEADALTVICLGLSGYVAFWIYYWSLLSGEIFSMAYLIGATALWGRRKTTGIRLIGPGGVLLCLVGILYISLLNLHGPSRLDASFTQSYFFFEPRSIDNLIPLWFEQAIIILHAPPVGLGDWLFSDRPPLQTGLSLYVFPMSKILGVESVCEAVGIFSQLLFLVGARMLLGTCGSNNKKATYIVLVLVTTGCIYFDTAYTWPKLLAACYSLIALAVVVKLWRTHCITMADGLMFGVSVSLAVLKS